MSPLRGGHLVVGSGEAIQLLGSEYARPSEASRDPEIAHVYQLDKDKAICGSSKDHKNVNLLDMGTMKILANHRTEFGELDGSFTPRFLCASIDEDIAILRLRKPDGFALRRCGIGWTHSLWEQLSLQPVLLGALSPDGHCIITVSGGEDLSGGGGGAWELCIRGELSGDVLNAIPFIQTGRPPRRIVFTSEKQFYTEERRVFSTPPRDEDESDCEDHHVQTTSTPSTTSKHPSLHPQEPGVTPRTWSFLRKRQISKAIMPKQPEARHTSPRVRKSVTRRPDEMTTSTTNSEDQLRAGVPHREYWVRKAFSLEGIRSDQAPRFPIGIVEVPGEEILPEHPYSLDENLEWMVDAKSRRVCWLPPGYVTGIEGGHFFVGSSIVTAGQDGIVRKLTFREPRSDS